VSVSGGVGFEPTTKWRNLPRNPFFSLSAEILNIPSQQKNSVSSMGKENIKGVAEVNGNKADGVKTLALRYGESKAASAFAFFCISEFSLTPIPWFLSLISFWMVQFVLVTNLGLSFSFFSPPNYCSRKNARKVKNLGLSWFIASLLACFSELSR
jgi:4-hydroxybenzoate polyprenyltransferase